MSHPPKTKTVCIIGAGPSGLIAAKSLTHLPSSSSPPTPAFRITIFEQSPRIGGLWPLSPPSSSAGDQEKEEEEENNLLSPSMRTNQSLHTVSFSDLAWRDTHAPFPRAWEVGRYLDRYVGLYGGEWDVRVGCRVGGVQRVGEGEGWVVDVDVNVAEEGEEGGRGGDGGDREGEVRVERHEFDYVVVASGFFGAARSLPGVRCGGDGDGDVKVPVWHSSRFRDVRGLVTDDGRLKVDSKGSEDRNGKRKIVVLGGQMSGVEVAANVAMQLSDYVNAPGKEIIDWTGWEVVHVVQRPVWVMPLFLPRNPQVEVGEKKERINNSAPDFLPCDLVSYNLAYKPPGELKNTGGHITVEAAEATHGFLNTYLGSDQSELGYSECAMKGAVRTEPPYVAVSDEYTEFVRSGNIKLVQGHTREFGQLAERSITVENETSKQSQKITNVAAVILATGFDAAPSLSFLPDELLDTLRFDQTCPEFPLALNVNAVVNRSLPSLGFVGFYRSPYWGVMEMQARFLAKLWSGDAPAAQALHEDTTMDTMLRLRRDPRRAQFPMGDYAYLMEAFAKILGIKRQEPDPTKDTRSGLVSPARYTYAESSAVEKAETGKALASFNNTFVDSEKKGKFLARAVFRAMQGQWKLERQIESFINTYPSGKFSGAAKFLPRRPTDEGYDGEYLYVESGDFETTTGMKFTAKRSYAYRYTSSTDKLSAWFIKADDKTVDYFFHELEFIIPPAESRDPSAGWQAKSFHLCTPDTYDVQYEFKFQGVQLREWIMAYTVKGPQKDYRLRSVYTR